jgi:choline dehydrogenase-like flavoprotein
VSNLVETTDVVVVGTGPGGAIPGFHLAAGGARVVFLERGPWLRTEDFTQDLRLDTYPRLVDLVQCDGVDVVAGNCVGGSSVVYFAAALRAPSFVFDRQGTVGRRLWPRSVTRASLDPWYDRVEETLPVSQQTWDDVPYAGGVWAAACRNAGRTCNPVPVAVDLDRCTNCNWMLSGCVFGAKRSMLLNYLPAAEAHGAQIRPLHEVQVVTPSPLPGYRYQVVTTTVDPRDYRLTTGGGTIHAKLVVLAAGALGTPVILQRSAPLLGGVPDAVGRYFSPNGDRVSMASLDEAKLRDVLGLERAPAVPYEGFYVGKPIGSMSYDRLDPAAPEFTRFALQQIYFPPITNILPGLPEPPGWFGVDKKALTEQAPSWLTMLAMTEDDNEGTFVPPPPTGSFVRVASSASLGQITYKPTPQTLRGWSLSDADISAIIEKDGIGTHHPWSASPNALTAHPLASCRMGDDPAISALDDRNELRGHPGIFITDGSAVPTSLCVNPSLTIAALAERSVPGIVERAHELGIRARADVPPPARS